MGFDLNYFEEKIKEACKKKAIDKVLFFKAIRNHQEHFLEEGYPVYGKKLAWDSLYKILSEDKEVIKNWDEKK